MLLREGRAEWGGHPVNDTVAFAEAVASLGIDRGIDSFQRFSLIERRGQGYYVALPIGRVRVREQRDVDLLHEVDSLLEPLEVLERSGRFGSLRRQIDSAVYDFALHGGSSRIQNILVALGRMEQYFAGRDPASEPKLQSPLSGLSARWIDAANDSSATFRIAVAVGSIRSSGKVGPIRANLAPVDPETPWKWATGNGQVAWEGNSLAARMMGLLRRRLMDGERLNSGGMVPLESSFGVGVQDVVRFLGSRNIDEARLEALIFACTLIDLRGAALPQSDGDDFVGPIPRSYALLKHLFDPETGKRTRPEPAVLSLLGANRTGDACEVAQRRLRVSSMMPVIVKFSDDQIEGIRLAAGLLIPIDRESMKKLSGLVLDRQRSDTSYRGER